MKDTRFTLGASGSPLGDLIGRTLAATGGWDVASMREPGFRMMERIFNGEDDPNFRALAPLPENSQRIIDNAVIRVGRERLTFANDIMNAGLVYNLTDPLSVTQLEWYKVNRVGTAQRTMTPSARGENKMQSMLADRLPIYLTTDTFQMGIRELRQSRRVGMPLDTAMVEACTRAVNESIEDAALNGATTLDGEDLAVAGYKAYGALNAPNAETQALTLADWVTAPVGSTVFNQTQLMLAKLRANKKYGPYHMYVNTDVGAMLDADYAAAKGDNTIKERLLKIDGLNAIKTADMLPANKVLLIQMTSDVIDMVVGQPPTVIPWTSIDGFTIHNLVMAIMIPRVRSDYENQSGICVGTLA